MSDRQPQGAPIDALDPKGGADEEWKAAYRDGWRGINRPLPPASPPLSEEFKTHLAYLDRLIGGIRELDTAASEQRIRRAHRLLKGGRR